MSEAPPKMNLWMIANAPDLAAYVVEAGVNRIFIDLETYGKDDRQRGRNAWLTSHSIEDVARVRAAVGANADILLRTDPVLPQTIERVSNQIDGALAAGADRLMPPMVRGPEDVATFLALVRGRRPVTPLIETPSALASVAEISELDGVDEIFIGLNDLHIALGHGFMFEPLTRGLLDEPTARLRARGVPFGIGGLARIGQGRAPAELVLGEHARLGSSAAILSRSFRAGADDVDTVRASIDMPGEIEKLRAAYASHCASSAEDLERNRRALRDAVDAPQSA